MNMHKSMVLAAAVTFAGGLMATTVERYRPLAIDVPTGSETLAGTLSADSHSGRYGKTGFGTLTLPLGSVLMHEAFRYAVWEGSLKITDDGSSPTVDIENPPAIMSDSILWFEAGENYEWQDEGAQTVATWHDRRETAEGGVYGSKYPRATAAPSNEQDASIKATYYAKAQTAVDGKVELNFLGKGNSGATMVLKKSDGTRYTVVPTVVFAVYNMAGTSGFGNLLGSDKAVNSCQFQDGSSVFFQGSNSSTPVFASRFFKDGKLCDPAGTAVGPGRHVITWERANDSSAAAFNALYNDRGYAGRAGGDGLCELVVFNRNLTAAERIGIEEYLMQKWIGKSRAPSYALETAKDVEVELDESSSLLTNGVAVSGCGTLVKKGAKTLTYPLAGSGAMYDYLGKIRVDEGDASAETTVADYAFKGGDSIAAYVSQTSPYDVLCITNSTPVAASEVKVAGDGAFRISGAFPSGVTSFSYAGQELVLSDVMRRSNESEVTKPVEVAISSPGFEGLTTAACKDWAVGKRGGWIITASPTKGGQHIYIFNPTNIIGGSYSYIADSKIPAPEGDYALGLRYDASFATTVEIPEDGVYELSFFTSSRVSYGGGTYEMSLINQNSETNIFGTVVCEYCYGWVPRRFSTGFVKAGQYTLNFRGLSTGDHIAHFDDFKMYRTATGADDRRVAIPNGDFEIAYPQKADSALGFSTNNLAVGWTLNQTGNGSSFAETDVAVVFNGSRHYHGGNATGGNGMLGFYGTGGTASTATFTYPAGALKAGTYRLTANACAWGSNYDWKYYNRAYNPTFKATLTVDGVEHDLGTTGEISSHLMAKVAFANPITLTGTESISLKIVQTKATTGNQYFAAGLIDNLALESVTALAGNLIVNGTFADNFTSWSGDACKKDDDEYLKNGNLFIRDLSSKTWKDVYGGDLVTGCGTLVPFLVQQARLSQQVNFPAPGTYRLSFFTRARPGYGGNAIHAYLGNDDYSVRQEIGVTHANYASKFFRNVFYFKVDAAGTQRLVLKGVNGTGSIIARSGAGGNQKDSNIAISCVTLEPVDAVEPFSIDEEVELALASGTKLRLDFDGTNTVKKLRLNGYRVTGTVDASHSSGLVSGRGALSVTPTDGMILIIR